MPKPRSETWQTCAPPQTPMQRGNFIDLCTAWLVKEPADDATPSFLSPRTLPPPTHHAPALEGRIAYTQSELHAHSRRPCFACKSNDAHAMVANPFAQRHMVLVCDACR